ncbi:DUF3298 and DUF4163 domain-containing protein [Paucihalobacter ruber]|uniref:DUF3298 and DUF4163 domain-containing protein n=1 Tax=Paucihalobacter ruber TaxID=2567861 RepID=A0A506PNA2_9FLAO|nr:DUF3298 and DUF4163 domain-containing protein [Paucihalobacter ruber]TPV34752.1 DUF3298 and DUF4163 domain-containing protein [Paucihalobacter ruber]
MFNKLDKPLKKLVLILVATILTVSCGTETGLDFKTTHFALEDGVKVEVDYPIIINNNIAAERINQTVNNYIVNAISFAEKPSPETDVNKAISDFNLEFQKFKADFPEDIVPWEAYIEGELLYNSPLITTIAINSYLFTGGAHGNDYIKLFNFNTETGEILKVDDVLDLNAEFMTLAKNKFEAEVIKNEGNVNDYFFGDDFKLPENMGLNDQGLIFVYNKYEIASYAQGYTEFLIEFNELEKFLKVR